MKSEVKVTILPHGWEIHKTAEDTTIMNSLKGEGFFTTYTGPLIEEFAADMNRGLDDKFDDLAGVILTHANATVVGDPRSSKERISALLRNKFGNGGR